VASGFGVVVRQDLGLGRDNVWKPGFEELRNLLVVLLPEDVSQVLMCYSPRVTLQPTVPNVIEWPHDSPGLALSSLSRDRHRAPWPDPTRQATVPVPGKTLCGADVPAGV